MLISWEEVACREGKSWALRRSIGDWATDPAGRGNHPGGWIILGWEGTSFTLLSAPPGSLSPSNKRKGLPSAGGGGKDGASGERGRFKINHSRSLRLTEGWVSWGQRLCGQRPVVFSSWGWMTGKLRAAVPLSLPWKRYYEREVVRRIRREKESRSK